MRTSTNLVVVFTRGPQDGHECLMVSSEVPDQIEVASPCSDAIHLYVLVFKDNDRAQFDYQGVRQWRNR